MGSSSSATVSANGILNINNDTDATTTSDGSLFQMVVYQLLKVFILNATTYYISGVANYGFIYFLQLYLQWYIKYK